jgi:hypothetical protein
LRRKKVVYLYNNEIFLAIWLLMWQEGANRGDFHPIWGELFRVDKLIIFASLQGQKGGARRCASRPHRVAGIRIQLGSKAFPRTRDMVRHAMREAAAFGFPHH